ncbi:MAG: ATP synthase subunit C [Spirochaetales bacterium]|nr:ATP synthase subunit C [Spirochaetales bacterium]
MKTKRIFKRKIALSFAFIIALMVIFTVVGGNPLFAESTQVESNSSSVPWALIAAAIAFGLGALGAGIAIANVGSAAMGAIGEKPEIASQALIFVALAEGIVVFGFITALMILGKV